LTTKLKKRLTALESRFAEATDESGLLPHTQEWFRYWAEKLVWQYEHPGEPGPMIPLEAFRAVAAFGRGERSKLFLQ
jgi:hypothetical protein